MRLVRALVLVLVLAGPAHAIVIDSGAVQGIRPNDFSLAFANMAGEGLVVTGTDIGGNSFPFPVTRPQTLSAPIDLSNTTTVLSRLGVGGIPLTVQHDGQTFSSGVLTGTLTFDVEPFFAQAVTPSSIQGSGPFTMTGSLTFGGETVLVEGIGTVGYSGNPIGANSIDPFGVSFNFSPVPEPATLTLVGTLGGLGALFRWRKRRTASQHEGGASEEGPSGALPGS